jgi:phage gpG-like protein
VKDNKFKLGAVKKRFEDAKKRLPRQIADESRSFFMKSFEQQGFNNSGSVSKWREVQRRIPGTNPYKYPKTRGLSRRTKSILTGTGRLKRSLRIMQLSFAKSVIATDVPYAIYHNEGSKYQRKRRFMGNSRALNLRVQNLIKLRLQGVFRM